MSFIGQISVRVSFVTALTAVTFVSLQQVHADLYFRNIWARSGTVEVGGVESAVWHLATTDTDESAKYTLSIGPLGTNGPIAPFGYVAINFDDAGFSIPGVDVANLGGSAISRLPHDIDIGDWAYGMAILEGSGQPVVESYFQIRQAGSSAVVQDLSLAQLAVSQGRWPSVDTYIEFNPNYAFYSANRAFPMAPSDYTGHVMPECSSATLMLIGLSSAMLRRKRRS